MSVILWLCLLGALIFGGMLGYVCWAEGSVPPPGETEAMIVLGAQVLETGEPSVQLELRLEAALKAYESSPQPVVVCGGKGANEPVTEASVMRAWLIAHGVNDSHVLADDQSVNTMQNIENALMLLPDGTKKVLIVTSDYHLPRAMRIASDLGLEPSGVGSPCKQEYWIKNHARETLAWGKYLLNKLIK